MRAEHWLPNTWARQRQQTHTHSLLWGCVCVFLCLYGQNEQWRMCLCSTLCSPPAQQHFNEMNDAVTSVRREWTFGQKGLEWNQLWIILDQAARTKEPEDARSSIWMDFEKKENWSLTHLLWEWRDAWVATLWPKGERDFDENQSAFMCSHRGRSLVKAAHLSAIRSA